MTYAHVLAANSGLAECVTLLIARGNELPWFVALFGIVVFGLVERHSKIVLYRGGISTHSHILFICRQGQSQLQGVSRILALEEVVAYNTNFKARSQGTFNQDKLCQSTLKSLLVLFPTLQLFSRSHSNQ